MNYLIAFFGSVVYTFALFVKAKDNCEKNNVVFDYVKYLKMNWDNWALTGLVAPILVWFMPELVKLVNEHFTLTLQANPIYYLGAGPLTELLYFAIAKLIGWKESFIAPIHKDPAP